MASLLRVERLTKSYGPIRALTDVSLTVRNGEVLGLIGPNGAGKTTLFECLAGVLPADRGRVAVGGADVATRARSRSSRSSRRSRSGTSVRPQTWKMSFSAHLTPTAMVAQFQHGVSGRIGLWAKTDSTSYFKDYVVAPK